MRYIQKLETPDFFITDTNGLVLWDEYSDTFEMRTKKRTLKEYILKEEQQYLCIYCESKITLSPENSHIEHIKPKDVGRYPQLTFDYFNLVVSCEGKCHNEEDDNRKYNCGHNKDNNYDENLFLNPTLVEDISDYFEYETFLENSISKIKIKESSKDLSKAEYMLNILNLNDENTIITKSRYLTLLKFENDVIAENLTDEQIQIWLKEENLPFISLLRYKYPNIINL
ncbi:MAG: retron system putative HNH endonuclease [Sulfurovum sp.]|nr:retron system putative HNH endonuclease [Sulfurovum sp.]